MDFYFGHIPGYKWIWQDISRYLVWISFLGYDYNSYPDSQKISCYILQYPCISFHNLRYLQGRTPRWYGIASCRHCACPGIVLRGCRHGVRRMISATKVWTRDKSVHTCSILYPFCKITECEWILFGLRHAIGMSRHQLFGIDDCNQHLLDCFWLFRASRSHVLCKAEAMDCNVPGNQEFWYGKISLP